MNFPKKFYLIVLFCFFLFSIVFGIVYHMDLNRPRVRHDSIPSYVHKFIESYNEHSSLHYVKDVSFGPKNWKNKDNLGYKKDWSKVDSSCFIVYYQKDKDAVWQVHAKEVMRELLRYKSSMQQLGISTFKNPEGMNNRKLPIYIPPTDSEYTEITTKIGGESLYKARENAENGFVFSEFGPMGFMTRAIVIQPSAFNVSIDEPGSYREIILAALANYNAWAWLDYALSMLEVAEQISPELKAADNAVEQLSPELKLGFKMAGALGDSLVVAMEADSSLKTIANGLKTQANAINDSTVNAESLNSPNVNSDELTEEDLAAQRNLKKKKKNYKKL